ncbi:MAG TPA: metallopeptidase TldD-related protein [Gemmatimonadales bacterium]|nr:metallopeptidase TldD-related protein [Gemmatimonadales bacterium]
MIPIRAGFIVAATSLLATSGWSPPPTTSPMLTAMSFELNREMRGFASQPTPPYFISYEIAEANTATIRGSFGAIDENIRERHRSLIVDLRVGTPKLDNTHGARSGFFGVAALMGLGGFTAVPLDDDTAAVRAVLWSQTDQRFKTAVQTLSSAHTNAALTVQAEDTSADFSPEPQAQDVQPVAPLTIDTALWASKIRLYTAPFARVKDIYSGEAVLNATVETRWYVNSEGTRIQTSQPYYRLLISAFSKADDGMELPKYQSWMALTPQDLPNDSTVHAAVAQMIADLHALRVAPVAEPFTGPAVLSGRASAVFFHEVFGHRVEGHRQKREDEGQTFKKSVNQSVLPAGFSVYSDPTLSREGQTDLAGYYRYDDEGVLARKVTVVDDGVLRNFLMSRSPIEGFPSSNGHGRGQIGMPPVARQSNLIITAAHPKTHAELKQMLIDEIKRQQKPFGLLFDDIEGGFTITERGVPNAFDVLPIMVYRVYPDGREELVRGVDFVGTPLTVFSQILAADDQVAVFNGMCGAESGWVPVSAVSPGILLKQIEVQKKTKDNGRPPILPAPDSGASR